MDVTASTPATDLLAFVVTEPADKLPDLDARLATLVESGQIGGAAGSTCVLHQDGGRRLVAAGAGPRNQLDADAVRDAAAAVARLGAGGTSPGCSTTPCR
jgi:hypothetical protein